MRSMIEPYAANPRYHRKIDRTNSFTVARCVKSVHFNDQRIIMTYEDILYEIKNGVATITINRPDKYNAFRGQTCEEMIHAFLGAGWDHSVGVIVLTGAGDFSAYGVMPNSLQRKS
jgi:1,4-dihydroxy-2-naphthoyl-CoA synthase